jgi:hypothetical protein
MAILPSEDQESASSIDFAVGEKVELYGQQWHRFSLSLKSGERNLSLGKGDSQEERDACMLCREPNDEAAILVAQLQELVERSRDRVLFEPAEPSFEMEVARSGAEGITVQIWLDAGNAKTGIYSWDAAGIRFFTTQSHLATFVEQLKQQFAC